MQKGGPGITPKPVCFIVISQPSAKNISCYYVMKMNLMSNDSLWWIQFLMYFSTLTFVTVCFQTEMIVMTVFQIAVLQKLCIRSKYNTYKNSTSFQMWVLLNQRTSNCSKSAISNKPFEEKKCFLPFHAQWSFSL